MGVPFQVLMEDEIVEKLASFAFTKEEEDVAIISTEDVKVSQQECALSALGKVITCKRIHQED